MPFIKAKKSHKPHQNQPVSVFAVSQKKSLWRNIHTEQVCAGESSAVIAWQASTGVGISHRIH